MAQKTDGPAVPRRPLGRTGEWVSAVGVGGWHLALPHVDADLAVRIVREAIDRGIDFLDNSWDYQDGEAERRMGRALRDGYRDRAFLMTKIDGRSRREATRQLEESLRRLQVDHVDLVQHHEVIRYEDPDRIFDRDGAQAALEDARREGKVRYLGFTGHKDPHIHLRMLEVADAHGVTYDAAQMPLNVMDAHFRSFEKLVVPELVRRGTAVLGMKCMGNGVILKSGVVTPEECLRYALSLPTSVVITGMDRVEYVEQAARVAAEAEPLGEQAREALLARTAEAAAGGAFELFKTTSIHDGTAENPDWLGEEPERVRAMMPA